VFSESGPVLSVVSSKKATKQQLLRAGAPGRGHKVGAVLDVLARQTTRHGRPPGGANDWPVVSTLDGRHLETWLWTTHPATSPVGPTGEEMASQTMDDLTSGSVIVLYFSDARAVEQTVAALLGLIRRARNRGYKFVDLSYVPRIRSPIGH
jgi:hypothetical protein